VKQDAGAQVHGPQQLGRKNSIFGTSGGMIIQGKRKKCRKGVRVLEERKLTEE
jgi:hypothetical protein